VSNTADIFILDGVNNSYIYNNLMFESGGLNGYITIGGGHNNIIANNTIIGSGSGSGIQTGPYGQTGQISQGLQIINNLMYEIGTPISINCHDNFSTQIACIQGIKTLLANSENNLVYNSSNNQGEGMYFGEGWHLDQWRLYTGYDLNTTIANPLFVNPSINNFRLQSGSPARAAVGTGGTNLSQYFNTDIAGTQRPSTGPWDIGAYQFNSTPVTDTTAPSIPANLSVNSVTTTAVSLSWSASTDLSGISGYKVYRNGTFLAQTSSTAYTSFGLTPATAYSFTVSAVDSSNNESAQSAPQSATTNSVGQSSLTISSGPASSNLNTTSASISWTTSAISTNSITYDLTTAYDSTATNPLTSATHAVSLTNLQPNTVYHYQVSSTASAQTVTSSDGTFTTSSVPTPSVFHFSRIFFERLRAKHNAFRNTDKIRVTELFTS
jgi:chitodextrinase